jgi:hypothetical protein
MLLPTITFWKIAILEVGLTPTWVPNIVYYDVMKRRRKKPS